MLAGLVHTPIARALSWALIHFLWEGAAIAALLAAALFVFRPASARARYGLACVALCAMLAAPGATLGILWPRIHADAGVVIRSGPLPAAHAPAPAPPGPPPALPPDPLPWVAPFWMAGVLVLYLRTAASWAAAQRLRRRGTIPADTDWQDRLRALARRLRVSRPVALLESCLAETPAVVGFLRPVILIPAGLLTGLAPEQVEAILLHELAHIRRHDYAVNVLQSLVEGLLFYHPAVWWVSGIIRAERENCCDDAVVAAVGDARRYAAALAALERSRSVGQPALAATGGDLKRRIHRLLEPQGPRCIAGPVLGATLLAVSIAAALMAWQPAAPQADRAAQEAQPRAQLATPYEKWLSEDAVYIIAPEEKAAFQQLRTDQEREQFIEQFWLRRDPTPGTVENEFKEEHYRRIAYANEHFTEGIIPGWKSHRGMYYIKFGPPDEIDDHRDSQPPFMAWTYRAIQPAPGAPAGEATVVFTDVDGSGRFILPRHTPASAVIMGTSPLVGVLNQTAKLLVGVPSFGGPTVVYVRIENQARATVAVAREEASAPEYTKAFQLPPGVYHIQVFVQRPGEGVIALFPRGQQFEIPGQAAAHGAAQPAAAAQARTASPNHALIDLDNAILTAELNLVALRQRYTDRHPSVVMVQAQLKTLQAQRRQAQAGSAAPPYSDDRTLVYGVLGPPDEIATEGDGQTWIYRHVEGAGDQVTFRFTNMGGSGRFVLAAAPTAGANANQSGLMDLATRVKAYGAQLDNSSAGASSGNTLGDVPRRLHVDIQGLSAEATAELSRRLAVRDGEALDHAAFVKELERIHQIVGEFDPHLNDSKAIGTVGRKIGADGKALPPDSMDVTLIISPRDSATQPAQLQQQVMLAKPPAEAPAIKTNYVIGAQDVLSILVVGERDYSGQYLVRPDGRISMPFIGEVLAAGRTPEELGKDLAERLTARVEKPQVSVSLAAVKSKKYYINGEVSKPGEFDLIVPTTVMEGLVQAGGFKEFADQEHIRILRNGGKDVLNFNFKEVLKGQSLEQNVRLESGDIIVVK